jgi:hypothetical protein
MRSTRVRCLVAAFAAAVVLAPAAQGQETPKKILVLDFDQSQVAGGFNDIFGRANVNVGQSIARFIAARLGALPGVTIVRTSGSIPLTLDPAAAAAAGRAAGADAVVAGSLVVYGSASGTATAVRPGIGRLRVNVGRRTTIVAVQLEARLVDVASGQLLGMIPGAAQGSRSGLAIGVEVPNLIDNTGFIDMTRDDFRRTAIGEFTDSAVTQLVASIADMRSRIGTMGAPPAPPAVAQGAPAMPAPAPAPSGPVTYPSGPFAYAPFQFRGTEHFRYTMTVVSDGRTQTGFYTFDLAPAGAGQVRMSAAGQLGEDSWSNTVTLQTGQQGGGPGAIMSFMPLMQMGPGAALLFNPATFMMFGGRQLSIGDGWSSSSGGDNVAVRVEAQCAYGGQGGLNVIMRANGQVVSESCLSPNVPMPLRSLSQDRDGDRVELVLVEFRP